MTQIEKQTDIPNGSTEVCLELSSVKVLKVGSRKSELALIQTRHVIAELTNLRPDLKFEIVPMSTKGDEILNVALSKIGEKSLFTKELEIALENKVVDFVVHSLKDLPTVLPSGMAIGAVLEREDPRDAVIIKKSLAATCLADLPDSSIIGTSSLRRAAQLQAAFPRLKFQDVRGNLNTRLKKLDDEEGVYAALILAVAGVTRMGWSERISEHLEPAVCMHAVGQGALAVECRQEDTETLAILAALHHRPSLLACIAERAFLRELEGGCSVPVAVTSEVLPTGVRLAGGVWSLDGQQHVGAVRVEDFSATEDLAATSSAAVRLYSAICALNVPLAELSAAERCGESLAKELKNRGAERILSDARAQTDAK